MQAESDNLALIREAYQQWHDSRGASVGKWLDLMSHGVRFRSLAGGAAGLEFSRDCANRDEVARYFAELGNDWDMIHYTVDELIAQGDRVIMLGSCGWKNRRTGIAVQTPKADFLRMKDGKVIEFFEFFDTAKAMVASLGGVPPPAT